MADQTHLDMLKQGKEAWNHWRHMHPDVRPNLTEADLGGADLGGIHLVGAELNFAALREADLSKQAPHGTLYNRDVKLNGPAPYRVTCFTSVTVAHNLLHATRRAMNVYESIVSETLLSHLPEQRGRTFMNHAANSYGIEEALSMASIFWPAIIEDDGYVFIAEFYTQSLEGLKDQFSNDKRKIERWVNAWSLPEFFYRYQRYHGRDIPPPSAIDDELLVQAFGEVLRFFWSLRLKTLFPDREFIIEVGDAIEGEAGLTITFYEV